MPTEQDVLDAIRQAHAASGTGDITYQDVAHRLGCAPDDAEYQQYLVRAVSSGLIREISSIDQLPGPTSFRYTP